ncbi:expressed unknown protein [Ectocarpus siliculosus]|uniref:Uncharacterized protein n=1 Tax=Ectocarpus siliculosus TaxID=2880 RepID=D7FR07_ECTSI|nr:expressed unknown protein [Ectocarpus siliculosus]|eukprot:CBJ26161.1 expressed unknown protein [Ectocarpus siliculosus]
MRELLEFLKRFDRAQHENTARELKAKKQREKKERIEAKKKMMAAKKNAALGNAHHAEKANLVDNVYGKMKQRGAEDVLGDIAKQDRRINRARQSITPAEGVTKHPRGSSKHRMKELTEVGEVVADGDEELLKVANMAKSVSNSGGGGGGSRGGGGGGGSIADGKPKKDRRTTMLGRFRRPRAAAPQDGGGTGGESGVETNAALANYITSKKDKKDKSARRSAKPSG